MTFCTLHALHAHHAHHEGSPERWGSAPGTGGVHSGKCELGRQSLAGATTQTLNFRPQAPRASLRPFRPTAQPTAARPAHSSPALCWARLLAACPGACSGKHQRSGTGRGRGKRQRQGCRGGQAPWAGLLGAGQRLRDTASQSPRLPFAFTLLPTPEHAHTGLCQPANISQCAHPQVTRTPSIPQQ